MVATVFLQQPENLVAGASEMIVEYSKAELLSTQPLVRTLEGLAGIEFALDMAEIHSVSSIQVYEDFRFVVTLSRDNYVQSLKAFSAVTSSRSPIDAARLLIDAIHRHVYVRQAVDEALLKGLPTGPDIETLGKSLNQIVEYFKAYGRAIQIVIEEVNRQIDKLH